MILKINTIINGQIYEKLSFFKNNQLLVENNNWNEFLFQNKERKNNKKEIDSKNFIKKRIKKNIIGFENAITIFGFNNELAYGYFLDYSSYVNIFLYFKNEQDIIDYVQDTCEARGETNEKNFIKITSFNDALNYLKKEDVVISKVEKIFIDEHKWNIFKKEYETK